jgi:hypothetical protein
MKTTQLIKFITVIGFSSLVSIPAQAGLKEDARKVYAENTESVLSIQGLLKINVSQNGQPKGSQEKRLATNGVVIADGLDLVAYRTIKPEIKAGAGVAFESELSEIKLIDQSGEEYDAKLVLHDQDLGLAFVALNPKDSKSKDFKIKPIKIGKEIKLELLDDVIGLSRLSEKLRSSGQIRTGKVISIIERPRTFYITQGLTLSNPIFTQKGEFAGLTVALKNSGSTPVIMPVKYINKLIDQAKAKQAELAK